MYNVVVIVYNMLDVSCITIAAFASLSLRWNPHREMKNIHSKDKVCLSGELSTIESRKKIIIVRRNFVLDYQYMPQVGNILISYALHLIANL